MSEVRVQLGAALSLRAGDAPGADARRLIRRAARAALRFEGVRDGEMSVTLLDDAEIAELNSRFLDHAGPTDVIAFPLYEDGEPPVGDVYIGCDQAVRQAQANGVDVLEELARLAIHGTLHVLGYDHPDGEDRLTSDMWEAQEEILQQVLSE